MTAAAAETGIALTLLPVFYAHAGFGGQPPAHGQRRFVTDLDGFSDLAGRCRALTAGLDGSVAGVVPGEDVMRAIEEQRSARYDRSERS